MYYVYLLQSCKFDKKYIGCTSDLKKRFKEHNNELVESTKKHKPWKLVYYEAYTSKYDAFNREKSLKSDYTRKRYLFLRINDSLKK